MRHAHGPPMRMAACAAALSAWAAGAQVAPRPGLPVIRAAGKTATGIFLNSQGHLAAPAFAPAESEWTVAFEGEEYPARVVSALPKYGFVVLRVERARPFPAASLAQKQAAVNTPLVLRGLDGERRPVERPVGVRRVRRRLPELDLEGSYYELAAAGEPPLDGAALVDATTGEVFGMLAAAHGLQGERFAIFAASMSERAAVANIPLGSGEPQKPPSLVLADDRLQPVRVNRLSFYAAAQGKELASRARAVQDWRVNTGFWINSLTAPYIENGFGYFGSTNGNVYCVDIGHMQREWVFENEFAVFSQPTVTRNLILIPCGNLGFHSWWEQDPVFLLLGLPRIRARRLMVDWGRINCIDQQSSVLRWTYKTAGERFIGPLGVAGDRVAFGGMGVLGVLNLSNGKEVWSRGTDRSDTSPVFYTVGGVSPERFWVVATKVRLMGDGRDEPFRLGRDGNPLVECYRMADDGKPVWSVEISADKASPALSAGLVLSPDGRTGYGALGKTVFAFDMQAGRILWKRDLFPGFFGGSLELGDSLLFATGDDNRLYAVNATDGASLWTFERGKQPFCTPLAHEGVVYVGSLDTWVYALDARTGRMLWRFETGGRVCGQPRVQGNRLYCMSDDGRLTELELPR